MKQLRKHLDQAKKQGSMAFNKTALGAMFASFAGYIPQPIGHIAVYSGGAALAVLNIIPTLLEKLDKDKKNHCLIALHYIKKLVAIAEAAAISGVYIEQSLEIKHEEAMVEKSLEFLIPGFAIILGTQGLLDLITKIEKMLNADAVDAEQGVGLVVGSGGTIAQAGMIAGILTGLVDKQTANGINALISGGQALTAGFFTFWNLRKACQYALKNPDLEEPLSVSQVNSAFAV